MKGLNYPIGMQSFSEIRSNGYVYIDKTEYIFKLLDNGKYKFLSRPRRFGKSLFISTLEAFFKGKKSLFEGLAIDRLLPGPWPVHPVIHLDFSGEDYNSIDVLEMKINSFLLRYERMYGLQSENITLSERFRNVVRTLHENTGMQVVILIDEYDTPITSTIDRPRLQARLSATLYGFYSSLKSLDNHLKFCMLTGVTKYGHLSVFSGLNNLLDISLQNDFAGICGITEDELHSSLDEGIKSYARAESLSESEALAEFKANYDGYHFSRSMLDVYNPYSLMNALASMEISDYWYRSGTPSILIHTLKQHTIDIQTLNSAKASQEMLENISSFNVNPIALFFQTGYLTIKDYDRHSRLFTLGYPNREIESGLMDNILSSYCHMNDSRVFVAELRSYLEKGNPEAFINALQVFFANIPYDLRKNIDRYENYYHTIFYVLTRLLGMDSEAEYHTSEGSIDLVIKTEKYIYIIELKINGNADDAMSQIKERRYELPFNQDARKLFTIGIGFAQSTHTIDSYEIR